MCQLLLAPGSKYTFPITVLYTVSSLTRPIFQALPVKCSAGPGSPLGKMACSWLPSLFDWFTLQLVVSNATEAIAIIINVFMMFYLLGRVIVIATFFIFSSSNNCFNNFCRYSTYNRIGRYILRHYRTRCYYCIFANGYAGEYGNTCTNPCIFF